MRTRCPAAGSAAGPGSTAPTCSAAALLAPLLLLALAAAVSGSSSADTATTPERDSPGRAAATQAVLDWLSGPNPGLPDGRLLQWSGARSSKPPTTENADTDR